MAPTYSTCALLDAAGGKGQQLNPFTAAEYAERCRATSSTSVVNVCVVAAKPAAHMADDVRGRVEAACVRNGRYELSDACVQALAAAPDFPGFVRSPTDPLFPAAQVCRTKLNGEFSATCGGRVVSFGELRSAVGAGCERCCETVAKEAAKGKAAGGEEQEKKRPVQTASAPHMPAYIPFEL